MNSESRNDNASPDPQRSAGRDHNPQGFSWWRAGGGIRGSMTNGATDEYVDHAVETIVTPDDLQATRLHLLGLGHERLTFLFGGRDFHPTDVHGDVLREILANINQKRQRGRVLQTLHRTVSLTDVRDR